jgi:hypothetical protein
MSRKMARTGISKKMQICTCKGITAVLQYLPMSHGQDEKASPPAAGAEQQRNAMLGFFRIMELWQASNAEVRAVIGSPPLRTFFEWKAGRVKRIPDDTLRRIGYVAGIFKALQILYADPLQADGWLRRPNAHFGGQAPLARMAAGDVTDLAAVRAYLDAARAPWS